MKQEDKKLFLFEKASIPKAMISLCIPTVISSLVMVIYSMADTYFVGMLNDPVQNAAVTIAWPALMTFNIVNSLFGVGASSMMSRALGKKDFDTVYRSSATGFYLSIFTGIVLSVLYTIFKLPILHLFGADTATFAVTDSYLLWTGTLGAVPTILNVVMAYLIRAEGASLHSSLGTMSGCILNIILDPLFILPQGLNMGAAGAGLATFLANCFACFYFFILLWIKRKKTYVCLTPNLISFDRKIILGICGVGIPASISNLLTVTGVTVLNNFSASFGSNAVAAMGIAFRVDLIPSNICQGLSNGIMPLISYNYASGNIKRMKQALSFTMLSAITFMTIVTFFYFVSPDMFVSLFINNKEIIRISSLLLRGLCTALPFYCFDFVAVGVFQACGLGKYSLLFALLRKLVLEIPALCILNYFFPLYGLSYAYLVAEVVLTIAGGIVLHRLFKKLQTANLKI